MSTQKNTVFLLTSFLLLCLTKRLNSVGPCLYDLNEKGIIDLTSVGRADGTPVWKNVEPETSDDHVYSYNPCHPFSQKSCDNVAACQAYATNENLTYSLGTQNSIQWQIIPNQDLPSMKYTSTERTLVVDLRCFSSGEYDKLEVHGHNPATGQFTMTLSSKCACWNGCKDSPSPGPGPGPRPKSKNGLSGGTVFIIILVVLVVIYLVAFMAFNKFKRQANGIEIIPHRTFWIALPGYSLAGVTFVFRKATGKETGYNNIP